MGSDTELCAPLPELSFGQSVSYSYLSVEEVRTAATSPVCFTDVHVLDLWREPNYAVVVLCFILTSSGKLQLVFPDRLDSLLPNSSLLFNPIVDTTS
jgi:hypothetical protein